jgi:hypothetical protein
MIKDQFAIINSIIITLLILKIVMPEQQKVDETVESTSLITDKKIPKKIENSYIIRKRK